MIELGVTLKTPPVPGNLWRPTGVTTPFAKLTEATTTAGVALVPYP
jgi:hypothetical protein